jgi:AcrR family transcriptional regulator
MATSRRVRLQTDERRTQLLELGQRVFSSRPYDEIAMDEVAEMAGVSKGLLYHYFSSKREFFVETIRAASLHLRSLTEPDITLAPGARLRAAIDAHLDYVREHGTIYATIYRSGTSIAPEVQDILDEHRGIVMQWLLFNLGLSKPRPLLRSALRAWIATVEGMSLDWIDHPELDQAALRELLVASYGALLKRAEALIADSSPSGERDIAAKSNATAKANGAAKINAKSNGTKTKTKAKEKPLEAPRTSARRQRARQKSV